MESPQGPQFSEIGFFEKVVYLLKHVTIEPVIGVYVVLMNTIQIVSTNFRLEKACVVNNDYSQDSCKALLAGTYANHTMVNDIQKTVSQMNSWTDPIQSILVFILLLFIGSWSDRNRRRKPCLLLPLGGEICSMIGLLICTYFYFLPVEYNGLIQSIFPGITGGLMCLEIAVYSYLSDVTKEEERTFRMSFVNTILSFTQPIGAYVSARIYNYVQYYGTFGSCCLLYCVIFLYSAVVLNEPTKPKPMAHSFYKDFFDLTHASDTFKVVFKRREGNGRMKIILVVLLTVLLSTPIVGESKVGQLFMYKQLGWDINKFSDYVTFYFIVTIVGQFIVLGLLASNLKLNDCVLGIIACAIKICVNILYTFSKNGTTFYILALFEILGTVSLTMIRSITTKVVTSEELGKLYAFCGLATAASGILIPSIYDLTYNFTIDTLPGAFFLIGSGVYLVAVIIFIFLNMLQNQASSTKQGKTSTNAQDNKAFEDVDQNMDIQTKL